MGEGKRGSGQDHRRRKREIFLILFKVSPGTDKNLSSKGSGPRKIFRKVMDYSLEKGKPSTPGRCRLTLFALAIFGALLLIGGSVVYVRIFPQALGEKVAQALTIRPGSEAEQRFLKPPVPVYARFHIFNVTNKDDVNEYGAKPILKELGPYVFRVDKERKVHSWDPEKGTLRYYEIKNFYFEPKMSEGKLIDQINHINVVSIGMGLLMQRQEAIFRALGMSVDEMISGIRGHVIETHSVGQMLFDGFSVREYFPEDNEHLCRLKNHCKFSFWKNNTASLLIEVNTGAKGIDDISHVVRYNNQSALPFWFGKLCNAINGSVGPQFKPGITKDDAFFAFSPEVCRSFEFVFASTSDVKGIPTLRFKIRPDALSYKVLANRCFCSPEEPCDREQEGLLMVGACHDGGPVAISWPHFYRGTPEQLQAFQGLKPEKEKHESYVDIESITGTALRGHKRIQANVIVKPDSRIKLLKNVNHTTYFPVFWAEEAGQISDELAAEFQSKVLTPYLMGKWSLLAAIGVGTVVMLLTLVAWTLKRPR